MKKILSDKLVLVLIFSFVFSLLNFLLAGQSDIKAYGVNTAKRAEFQKPVKVQNEAINELILQKINSVNQKIGQTLTPIAFDESNNIEVFNLKTAKKHLDRRLFAQPNNTASYYYAKFDEKSVSAQSVYLQIVSDSKWNRLLYGTIDGQLYAYNDIELPGAIAINSAGKTFVAERGKNQIKVLKITTDKNEIDLIAIYDIKVNTEVGALAYHDGGSPFNYEDDFLYATDVTNNRILKIKVNENTAEIIEKFDGFKWPVAIEIGKWNGASTNHLYVIDNYAKRITLFADENNELVTLKTINANLNQSFSQIKSDYFGQIYLAESQQSELLKFSWDLNLLDSQKNNTKAGIYDIDIPFGTIEIVGEEKIWTGFDQLFALQNWTETSGVQRYKLGQAFSNFKIDLNEDSSEMVSEFMITDFADVAFKIVSANDQIIYNSENAWLASGYNALKWSRKDDLGKQVKAGQYKIEMKIASAYDESTINQSMSFYLPLFYYIDCGIDDPTDAFSLIDGKAYQNDTDSFVEDHDQITYLVKDLNPQSEYKISAAFLSPDEQKRTQNIYIDGYQILDALEFAKNKVKTEYIDIPKEAFADGQINITISSSNDNSSVVSDLWLKESGRDFVVKDIVNKLPESFKLKQNFPNPFNPVTKIQFDLVNSAFTTLTVFDMLGKKVRTLINESKDAGVHTVEFDAEDLSSGVYFYQLKAGTFIETRKMLLVK